MGYFTIILLDWVAAVKSEKHNGVNALTRIFEKLRSWVQIIDM